MDNSKSSSSIKFKAKNGFFVERWTAFFLVLFFLGSLVAVGLLVYYFSPCHSKAVEQFSIGHPSLDAPLAQAKVDVLLPKSLRPIHYKLELQPFLSPSDGNFSFSGSVQIRMQCETETKSITLHIKNLTIYESTVKVKHAKDGSQVEIEGFSYDTVRQFFIINLKTALTPGNQYNVSIQYLGLLNDDMAGFYRSSYKDENGTTKWLAVTQFQPTDARMAFPCFDEPAFKAKFDTILVRPANMTSLSNMPIDHTEERENNYKADVYKTTLDMSTYLLAFVVCDFTFQAKNATNTEFRVWVRPSAMQQVEYALNVGPQVLNFFEQYFNVTFPLPKQDMIAVPDFRAGAMENWGLITYRETALLWDPKISSPSNKQRVLTVVVHELAHQWFGNLVTPKWWDDLWLNEGFASYMEFVGSDHVEPTWKMFDQFLTDSLLPVMELDSLESSHPVSVPVNDPDEINEIFDQISYSKGASIIRMMEHFLGQSIFRKGLTNYLTKLSYQNAVQDDLWQFLSDASSGDGVDIDVKAVMDTWTLQTGYPVIKVERDYSKQSAKLTQKRFFLSKKEHNDSSYGTETWHIPITYTSSVERNFTSTSPKTWFYKSNESIMLDASHGVPTSNDWMIFNVRGTAYHRTNYDNANWKLLNQQLSANHETIDVTNRALLIDDALDLARAGELDYETALNMTLYLEKEFEYVPWDVALSNFAFIDRMLKYTAAYGNWMKYVLKKISPAYARVGFEDLETDTHLHRLLRANLIAWACKVGHPDCLKKSASLYAQWMQNPDSDPISPNVKKAVVCSAIHNGGEAEWKFAFDRYKKSNVGAEKDMLLSAMCCSEQPWILGKYLALSLEPDSGIRKADSGTVFVGISRTPTGRFMAFDFLRDKWDKIKKIHGSGFFIISNMIKSVTSSLNTPFELKELKEFVSLHRTDLGSATRTFQQAVEQTEANVLWMEQSYSVIDTWLNGSISSV